MALPEIKSWQSREVVSADKLNEQIRDVNAFLTNPPYALCKRSSSFSTGGGGYTSVVWDNNPNLNGVTANGAPGYIASLRIIHPGIYYTHFALGGKVTDTAVSHFMADIKVNGVLKLRGVCTTEDTGYQDTVYAAGYLSLQAEDLITTEVYVSSGRTASFCTDTWQQSTTRLSLHWMGGI